MVLVCVVVAAGVVEVVVITVRCDAPCAVVDTGALPPNLAAEYAAIPIPGEPASLLVIINPIIPTAASKPII